MVSEIKALCDANGTSIKALEKELGFGNGTIRRWDVHEPSAKRVDMVAERFGITAEELKKGIKKEPTSNRSELISSIIELFNQLTPEEAAKVLAYTQGLVDNRAD